MMTETEVMPVFETVILTGIQYHRPDGAKHGWTVGKVKRDNWGGICLFPNESFPLSEVNKYIGKEIRVKSNEKGQLRTSLVMQKLESLEENDELIAVAIQNLETRLMQFLQTKFDEMMKEQILTNLDINKLRQIFYLWNREDENIEHAIPTD
jgi:hypothetical protein|tara:strand:- start:329 stop:784 length:456 start_codon:yes stop_codon:yes gene_type:complete